MRSFLAVEIPDEIKEYIKTVVRGIAIYADGVKWVNEAARHITLKFFGEIEEEMAWNIKKSIEHIGLKYSPFVLTLKDIDAFPSKKRARVIVITLENGVDNIVDIFNDIEQNIASLGIEKDERSFMPHITLGRRKVPTPLPERTFVEIDRKSFNVNALVLFKSTLTSQGAIYTPVWEIKIQGQKGVKGVSLNPAEGGTR
ncbi:MAG: RNA 2',3'-cyclic phosphodiesterase [Proteobacteria bacterium]|nr:RNA 2',3'-cyclic phosphodiesterase [Pseudomonadota bacterium]